MLQQATKQHNAQKTTLEVDEGDIPSKVYQWVLSWCKIETGELLDNIVQKRERLSDLVEANYSSLAEERRELPGQNESMQQLDVNFKEDETRIRSLLSDLEAEQALLDEEDASYQVPVFLRIIVCPATAA